MREYAKRPENQSRTLNSNPRASRQAPIADILQAYKNGTLGRQPVQRESMEDEELLQAKTSGQAPASVILQRYKESIQRYAPEEDDELLQGKFDTAQREEIDEDELLQGKFESNTTSEQELVQREEKPNNTGLPDDLKTGIESLSGYNMDDVKVHYNSDKPAQLQALAYTQGTDIHVAPGQEKHLAHEIWHVVQQKQGRVQSTMQMHGVNVNDNEGLEREADVKGEKVLSTKSNAIQKQEKTNSLSFPQIRQYIIQMVPEEGSVFDIQKMNKYLIDIFPNRTIGKKEITGYSERVQELFEDIRQVDLQFLAATSMAYDEDDPSFNTQEKYELTDDEKKAYEDNNMSTSKQEEQKKYKNLIFEKLEYLKIIKSKIVKLTNSFDEIIDQKKEKFEQLKYVKNSRRRKKTLSKEIKQIESKIKPHKKYLSEIESQIELLNNIIANSSDKGYVFNQNALLTSIDGKVELYMAIVAPGRDRFKDIIKDEDDKLKHSSDKLQISMATPVRSFSWYLKYLVDEGAKANNPPLIRSFEMDKENIKEWQLNAVSEAMKKDDHISPMNEDFKVPDQYGTYIKSKQWKNIEDANPDLTTFTATDIIPSEVLKGSGDVKDIDKLKKQIGFGRYKNNKFVPTDVHLFDSKDTAFFEIEKGSARFYSPQKAREKLNEYGTLMLYMEYKWGTDTHIDNLKKIHPEPKIEYHEAKQKIKDLLITNHCVPENYDIKGSGTKRIEEEQKQGLNYLKNKQNTTLINITEKKLNNEKGKKRKSLLSDSGVIYELSMLRKIMDHPIYDINNLVSEQESPILFIKLRNAVYSKDNRDTRIHASSLCFKILRNIKNEIVLSQNNVKKKFDYFYNKLSKKEKGIFNKKLREIKVKDRNEKKLSMILDFIEKRLFADRKTGDFFSRLNPEQNIVDDIEIPYDKFTSTGRFIPEEGKRPNEAIPFMGGASGTTRDISKDLLCNKYFNNEKEYYDFQLLNASFMSTYGYHSFIEAIYRAAIEWIHYNFDQSNISKKIVNYILTLNKKDPTEKIRTTIIEFINKY
jgi:hypothetical protein